MLIVGGKAPRQDVLLGFKVLQGNLTACFPLALPGAGMTHALRALAESQFIQVVSVQILILPLLTLKKSPSLDGQSYPIDKP